MEATEGKVDEEQGELKKGKGCVDQIFVIKIMVEVYLRKMKKLNNDVINGHCKLFQHNTSTFFQYSR